VTEQPLLSVVITSYTLDRLKDITALLDSVKAQTYNCLETILVIERSAELLERVRQYGEERAVPNMKVIFNYGEPGASASRNLGIKEAKGDIIAFVDDDVLLSPEWAEEMGKAYLEDDSIIGVAGSAEPLWEDESMSWFPEELYWIIGCTAWSGWKGGQEVRSGAGLNMSFKREGIEMAGGFLSTLGPRRNQDRSWAQGLAEDAELSLRIQRKTGKPIIYNPKVRLKHRVYRYRLNIKYVAERSYQVGSSRRMLKRFYGQGNQSLLDPERDLLKRILTKLSPNILKSFFTHPMIAWRKLSVTVIAVFFVAFGYFCYSFQRLLGHAQTVVHESL